MKTGYLMELDRLVNGLDCRLRTGDAGRPTPERIKAGQQRGLLLRSQAFRLIANRLIRYL